jgi:hypothetical protein
MREIARPGRWGSLAGGRGLRVGGRTPTHDWLDRGRMPLLAESSARAAGIVTRPLLGHGSPTISAQAAIGFQHSRPSAAYCMNRQRLWGRRLRARLQQNRCARSGETRGKAMLRWCAIAAVCARVSVSSRTGGPEWSIILSIWGGAARPDSTPGWAPFLDEPQRTHPADRRRVRRVRACPATISRRAPRWATRALEMNAMRWARTDCVEVVIACRTKAIPPATTPSRRGRRAAPLQLRLRETAALAGERVQGCRAILPERCARTTSRRESFWGLVAPVSRVRFDVPRMAHRGGASRFSLP